MISSVSYIDWCLTATRPAPFGGVAFDPGADAEDMARAPAVEAHPADAPSARIAAVPNRLIGKESSTARHGAAVEDQREQERAQRRHGRS